MPIPTKYLSTYNIYLILTCFKKIWKSQKSHKLMANYLVFIVPGLFWSLIGIEKGALTKSNCEFCCWYFVTSLVQAPTTSSHAPFHQNKAQMSIFKVRIQMSSTFFKSIWITQEQWHLEGEINCHRFQAFLKVWQILKTAYYQYRSWHFFTIMVMEGGGEDQ